MIEANNIYKLLKNKKKGCHVFSCMHKTIFTRESVVILFVIRLYRTCEDGDVPCLERPNLVFCYFFFRKHYLKFPPGVLDRHFENLLQCDSRLFELSRKPFPTLDSPYFHQSCIFEHPQYLLSFNGQSPHIYHGLDSSHSHMSPPLFPAQQLLSPPQVQSHQMQVQLPSFSFKDLSSPDSGKLL